MADINLTQAEANTLIEMEKRRVDDKEWFFPPRGDRIAIPLTSLDKRENFMLDLTRAQIKLTKATFQNRARHAIILMRLDLDGPPHRNPDDQEIPCPHLHVYREGYGDNSRETAQSFILAWTDTRKVRPAESKHTPFSMTPSSRFQAECWMHFAPTKYSLSNGAIAPKLLPKSQSDGSTDPPREIFDL
jgi:hypothetical protein